MIDRLKYFMVFLVFAPLLVSAHGLETSQAHDVGAYTIEFEYNTVGNILAGDYTLFNTYLLNRGTEDGVDFDSVFIRIEKQNGPAVLSGNLAESVDIKGYASLSGTLNDPGTYTAEVSFYKFGKTLAESKFDFNVEKNATNDADAPAKKSLYFGGLMLVAGLVLGAAWFLRVYKPPKI
jgi:hypothetical protein